LFGPLGITDISWDSDLQGITTGATGLLLRPRDMAKIGYLYLHKGQWKGKQLLPKEWVESSTKKHIETKGFMNEAEQDGYGYLWWIDSFGGYSAHGFGGQYIFVLPSLDMLIVFTGGLPDPLFPAPKQLVQSYLIPAARAKKPLAKNDQAFQSLASYIHSIEQGEQIDGVLPVIAQEISGKTIRLMDAPHFSYQAITLTFTEGGVYENETQWPAGDIFMLTGSLEHAFYLNQVTFPGPPAVDLLLPLRGYWQDEVTFIEEYLPNLNTDIDIIRQKYTFSGSRVIIEISSGMGLISDQITGEVTN
jgi:hypothetical protein